MANWLFLDKSGTYGSLKPQKGKDGKPNDAWNIHLSFDEMIFTEADGMFTVLTNATACTGHSVMKDQQDKVKFPMPVKIQFKTEGATVGERCLMAVIKGKCEPGKYYSGFIAINDENPFALAIADGKKADGSPMSEADIAAMSGQFIGVMESAQKALTPELQSEMGKAKSGGSGGGYSRGESKAEQIAARESKLKAYLGLKPEATFAEILTEFEATSKANPSLASLLSVLLA